MKKITIVSSILSIMGILILLGSTQAGIEQIILRVDGLACPFCAYGLEKKITNIKGVTTYEVDMKQGKVFIGLKPDAQIKLDSLYKTVKEAGFTLRSISLRVKGKIQETKEGLVLVSDKLQDKFLLYQSQTLSEKYHQGEISKALSKQLKDKLLEIKKQGKEVLIEGVVTRHKELPYSLSIENFEIMEETRK